MTSSIRIMLVEDHPEYREIVEMALNKEPDMELVGEFGTSERALRSLQDGAGRTEVDVILLDLNLPGMGGLESIPHFAAAMPKAKIVILTQSDREGDVLRAIMLGASGYQLKSSTVKQITEGIRTVHRGGASLDPSVAKFILNTLQTKLPRGGASQVLTERETEILKLLADGLVKKTIADQLDISVSTVVTHVVNIYGKLQVQNAPSAIAKAFRLGILSIDKLDD